MTLGKSKIFLLFCLSSILGVFLGKYLNYYLMAILAMIFIVMTTVWWSHRKMMLLGFLGLSLVSGAVRYQTSLPKDTEANFIGSRYGQKQELRGIIVKDPDVRSDKTNLVVKAQSFTGKILVTVGRYPEYRYGDELRISGKIEEPFETQEFSYKDYLSRFEIYAVMRFPEIEKLAPDRGNKIIAALLNIKHEFQEVLSKILPEPHNALVLGLILGLKRALPEGLREALILTGVSHIVVISGYNISIITRNLLKTRMLWGRKVAFWLSLLAVLIFVILTGAEASVIRAAIMGLLLVFALNIGRLYQATNALVFAGTVMIALNPKILFFDIGFQLSFLATLGLIYSSPIFEKWLTKLPDVLGFRTNLASTLAAQLFTLPLLIFYFDRISLIAPLVNVLILWVIPYVMLFGFVSGLSGMIFLPVGQLVAAIPWVLLEFLIRTIEFFAALPLASVFSKINIPVMVIYYLLLVSGIWIYRHKKKFYYQVEYVKQQL